MYTEWLAIEQVILSSRNTVIIEKSDKDISECLRDMGININTVLGQFRKRYGQSRFASSRRGKRDGQKRFFYRQ